MRLQRIRAGLYRTLDGGHELERHGRQAWAARDAESGAELWTSTLREAREVVQGRHLAILRSALQSTRGEEPAA